MPTAITSHRARIQLNVNFNRLALFAIVVIFRTAAAPHSIPSHRKADGVPNFAEVTPHLYRGGQPNIKGLENLKKMGVDIVIDMRGGSNQVEESAVNKLGMQYVSIPWHCPFPTDEPFARFLKVIDDNPGKKVFVHCRLGDDRTGLAIAAYRMANEGWSPDDAMNEMKEFGFTGVHRAICPGIAPYEKHFPEHLKHDSAFKNLGPPGASSTSK